jgi:hypothetical protein
MADSAPLHHCSCPCGETRFTLHREPVMRIICHCTVCQQFNEAPFADVTILLAKGVNLPEGHQVDFRAYRPPPAVQRGKCKACDKPAVEFLRLPIYPGLSFVPTANFTEPSRLPEPCMHLFYEKRVADLPDALPKHSGYLRSQLAFARHFYAALLGGTGRA